MVILGINAFHPDAAAVLIVNGKVVAAVEEERLTRVKHAGGFPEKAIAAVLEIAGVAPEAIDHVAFARHPEKNMAGPILYALSGRSSYTPELRAALEEACAPVAWRESVARALGVAPERLRFEVHPVEHQTAHAASAFYASPLHEAAILTVDTVGDYGSTLLARGQGDRIEPIEKVLFPHSLGLFYGMVSQLIGFEASGDESRTMGLSAFGGDRFLDAMRRIVRHARSAAFELDLDFFSHNTDGAPVRPVDGSPRAQALYSEKAIERFGPPRAKDAPIGERERDLAFAAQRVLEERLCDVAARLRRKAGTEHLVYAGHVAMNCVANRALRRAGLFRSITIAPVPNDAGTALGAALEVAAKLGCTREALAHAGRRNDLGPSFPKARVRQALSAREIAFTEPADVAGETAEAIAQGEIVGWFDGRMEFGARALGRRSVLADPRRAESGERLRKTLSHRETYRSFGASVPLECAARFFDDAAPSPLMLDAFRANAEAAAKLPAVVHKDGTTRVHTVAREEHPGFHALLEAFGARTGMPLLLNTSFNADAPIVCTPEEAIDCALAAGLDRVVIEGVSARLRASGADAQRRAASSGASAPSEVRS